MKSIIERIKQKFCDHEMQYFNDYTTYYWDDKEGIPLNYEASWRCKKCGWIVRREWK